MNGGAGIAFGRITRHELPSGRTSAQVLAMSVLQNVLRPWMTHVHR
jgi:hypothetical protein